VEIRSGNGTRHGHGVHGIRSTRAISRQASMELEATPRGRPIACAGEPTWILPPRRDLTVFQDGAGGVSEYAADSENDHVSVVRFRVC